jgi:hypothetical protein
MLCVHASQPVAVQAPSSRPTDVSHSVRALVDLLQFVESHFVHEFAALEHELPLAQLVRVIEQPLVSRIELHPLASAVVPHSELPTVPILSAARAITGTTPDTAAAQEWKTVGIDVTGVADHER